MMTLVLGYATCGAVFFGLFLVLAKFLCNRTYWQILDESIADDAPVQIIVELYPVAYWAVAVFVPASFLGLWPYVLYKIFRGILKKS